MTPKFGLKSYIVWGLISAEQLTETGRALGVAVGTGGLDGVGVNRESGVALRVALPLGDGAGTHPASRPRATATTADDTTRRREAGMRPL